MKINSENHQIKMYTRHTWMGNGVLKDKNVTLLVAARRPAYLGLSIKEVCSQGEGIL